MAIEDTSVPSLLIMSRRIEISGRRRHLLTVKMKALAASALAEKIGYLRVDDFPNTGVFNMLPTQSYGANRMIRCKEELLIVREGIVEIWHTRYDTLVKELEAGAMFGEIPLLGQTTLGTRPITGKQGATISVMNVEAVKEWIMESPVPIFAKLGYRLSDIETEHYRSQFQLADSRIAALLLELAKGGSTIEGVTHQKIGEQLGLYRETVTVVLDAMKMDKLIEVDRMKIVILDKRALRELSEL